MHMQEREGEGEGRGEGGCWWEEPVFHISLGAHYQLLDLKLLL